MSIRCCQGQKEEGHATQPRPSRVGRPVVTRTFERGASMAEFRLILGMAGCGLELGGGGLEGTYAGRMQPLARRKDVMEAS